MKWMFTSLFTLSARKQTDYPPMKSWFYARRACLYNLGFAELWLSILMSNQNQNPCLGKTSIDFLSYWLHEIYFQTKLHIPGDSLLVGLQVIV